MNRLISTFVLGVLLLGAWTARAQEDPNCAGAPMPRLSVGAQARVLPGDANNVRDSASRSGALVGSIPGGGVFTVLEGPVCADGFNWWGVEYNGLTGWTVEGSGADYWVEPYTASVPTATRTPDPYVTVVPTPLWVSDFQSPVEAVNVLEIGARVRVINDDLNADTITLTVRAQPTRSSASVTQAHEGDLLTIIGGPEEADSLRWWQVETDTGTQGWVVEGLTDPYTNNAYRRTLLALCHAEGERIVFSMMDFIVTSAPDGSEPCVLDHLVFPGWVTFRTPRYNYPFAVSPDGEYILYAEQPVQNEDSRSNLYRLKFDGSERLVLTHDSYVGSAAWSPDGQRIAIAAGWDVGIEILNWDGSSPFALAQISDKVSWVAWLPDGQTLIYATIEITEDQTGNIWEHVFYRVNISDGTPQEIFRTDQWLSYAPNLSPDGTMLAMIFEPAQQAGDSRTAKVFNLETDTLVFEGEIHSGEIFWSSDAQALVSIDLNVEGDGALQVLPINGDDVVEVELPGAFPEFATYAGYAFVIWETDSVFLLNLPIVYGRDIGSIQTDAAGIWAVNVLTGEVKHRT